MFLRKKKVDERDEDEEQRGKRERERESELEILEKKEGWRILMKERGSEKGERC